MIHIYSNDEEKLVKMVVKVHGDGGKATVGIWSRDTILFLVVHHQTEATTAATRHHRSSSIIHRRKVIMDAQAKKKALYRAKLKAQKQDKRIDSPLVRYNESDQPVCKVCDIVLKSESAWSAHQISAKHREAIQNVKAAASRANNVKPGASTEYSKAKAEPPAETYKSQTRPPQAQPQSGLPPNFFDNPETKTKQNASRVNNVKPGASTEYNKAKSEPPAETHKSQSRPPQALPQSGLPPNFFDNPETKQNETNNAKLMDKKKKLGSAQAEAAYPFDGENKRVEVSSGTVAENVGDGTQASQTQALPEGFFDDKDADLRARGITPVKLDIKDEYKEFEKLIQEDLKEVDNRLEEEEYDAAEMIEEAETVEQKFCRERVEMFKRKKMELKAARSAKRSKKSQVVEKESSLDESSSDEDSDDAVDWRAKHL
ncbi:hypothetical protein QVD17_18907 [Tagetes erecta]|uniref:U1-type domain-containing protein n=1 Tax=Tagetes erecta TaxID=13708 RepID=A0AAD8NWG1_TARER|nr:hypothetical protein QVD17_18907 [Tagetes erecta]